MPGGAAVQVQSFRHSAGLLRPYAGEVPIGNEGSFLHRLAPNTVTEQNPFFLASVLGWACGSAETMKTNPTEATKERHEFRGALRNGLILCAVLLLIAILAMRLAKEGTVLYDVKNAPTASITRRLPDFGSETASADVRHVANWAFFTGDHQGKAVIVLDKKGARVYAFEPSGKLMATAPVLLGAAIGDHTAPGVGDKPLSAVLPEEKTTPAGRFIAEAGMNTAGEDIVWVDYDAAVSMHRVRPAVAAERRLERLVSPTVDDNRISFGCINLPVAFYEGVLSPTVKKTGAVIYILPETRTPQELFRSYDVTDQNAAPVAANLTDRGVAHADATARQARRNHDFAR